jgi:hypothetical protein
MVLIETPLYYFNTLAGQVRGNEFKFLIFCHWWTAGFSRKMWYADYETIEKFTRLDRKAFFRVIRSLEKQNFIEVLEYVELSKGSKIALPMYTGYGKDYLFSLTKEHRKEPGRRKEILWLIASRISFEDGQYVGNDMKPRSISFNDQYFGDKFPIQTLVLHRDKTDERKVFTKKHRRVSLGVGEFTIYDNYWNETNEIYSFKAYRI